MSILITGMEMPTDRSRWVVIYPDGKVDYSDKTDEWETLDKKAVPVPPHGDLIDRDKLRDDGPKIYEDYVDSDGYCWDSVWGYTEEQIEKAPTIIPADKEGE